MMKYLFFALIVLLHTLSGSSQSYIGASAGADYAQIRESNQTSSIGFHTLDHGYTAKSIIYGIRGEQFIAESFALSLQLSYTEKEFDASFYFLFPVEGVRFKSYRGALSVKWYAFKNWYVAQGVTMNYISDLNYFIKDGIEHPLFFIDTKREYGGILSTGYLYKNFMIELSYNRGASFRKTKDRQAAGFKPINSFGFSLSYLLRVSKKKRK